MCLCVLHAHDTAMSHADLQHACSCTLDLQLHLLIPGLQHRHVSHMHDQSQHLFCLSMPASMSASASHGSAQPWYAGGEAVRYGADAPQAGHLQCAWRSAVLPGCWQGLSCHRCRCVHHLPTVQTHRNVSADAMSPPCQAFALRQDQTDSSPWVQLLRNSMATSWPCCCILSWCCDG